MFFLYKKKKRNFVYSLTPVRQTSTAQKCVPFDVTLAMQNVTNPFNSSDNLGDRVETELLESFYGAFRQ